MLKEPRVGKLFRKYGQVEVMGQTVYLRGLSKVDADTREAIAISAASDVRDRLRDKSSVDYERHVLPVTKSSDKDGLVAIVLRKERASLNRMSQYEVFRENFPEAGDHPDLDEVIDVAVENKNMEDELRDARVQWVKDGLEKKKAELEGKSIKVLREEAAKVTEQDVFEAIYTDTFVETTIYLGCFSDEECKKPLFGSGAKDADDIEKSVSAVIDDAVYVTLRDAYFELDRWSGEDLKN